MSKQDWRPNSLTYPEQVLEDELNRLEKDLLGPAERDKVHETAVRFAQCEQALRLVKFGQVPKDLWIGEGKPRAITVFYK